MPLRLQSERVKVLHLCQINYRVGCRFLHERLSFCRLRTVQSIVLSSLTMEAALARATHLPEGRINHYLVAEARKGWSDQAQGSCVAHGMLRLPMK